MPVPVRVVLSGFGNVHRSLLDIFLSNVDLIRREGIEPVIVGVTDSSGAAVEPGGLDIAALLEHKRAGGRAATFGEAGRPGMTAEDVLGEARPDVLFEATPTDLQSGNPALQVARAALSGGTNVVLASKGALVVAFDELTSLTGDLGPGAPALRYSSAVGGALPTINSGVRDLAAARVTRFEAVLNSTTQVILASRSEGRSWGEALSGARELGLTETDPTLDIDGWDAAAKLVIVANAVLRRSTRLSDIAVQGIRDVTAADLAGAKRRGGRVSLLAVAELIPGSEPPDYHLRVGPAALHASHPLAHLAVDEMGAVYHTDIYGRLTLASADQGPLGTAAAMVRDLIDIRASTS